MHAHPHARPAPFAAPIVRLDGAEIPAAEIAAEMQHHPAESPDAAWQAAAEALLIRRLLLAEAARQGIDATPEGDETADEAQVRRLLAAEITVPEADDATCRRWFAANRARFRTPPAWEAEHVLLAADPADAQARAAARARAEAALRLLREGGENLPAMAAALSDCPSRSQGGDLGLVTAGSTVPEFEAALAATPPGALHDGIVETRFGFHLLRVRSRAESRDLPFEAVQERIAAWLRESAWRRAAHQYMAILAGRARVEGIALSAGADGPLVQ